MSQNRERFNTELAKALVNHGAKVEDASEVNERQGKTPQNEATAGDLGTVVQSTVPIPAIADECQNARKWNAQDLNLVVDDEIRDVVPSLVAREARHEARSAGERRGCDPATLQQENLDTLLLGNDADGMGALLTARDVDRPIYVWARAGQKVIVDGIKTFLAAKRLNKLVTVVEMQFRNIDEAKAWRWYVNVASSLQAPEDARVWTFLHEFQPLIQKWRDEGKVHQGQKAVSLNSEKLNWRLRAATLCLTTRAHVDSVYSLRQEAEKIAALTPEERNNLSPVEVAAIKSVEDGVQAVLSGARSASSVMSDIKGGSCRHGKSNKGEANKGKAGRILPAGTLTNFDPTAESQLIVGDSLAILPTLPEGAFKYLIGSPPYYGANVNYGIVIPWLESLSAYEKAMDTYIRNAYRIMPVGGGVIINIADVREPGTGNWYRHHRLIQDICLSLGMIDAGLVIWSEQNTPGKKHAKGSVTKPIFRPNYEYVLAFFKGGTGFEIPTSIFGEMNYLTLGTWKSDTEVEEINCEHWEIFSNFWEIAPANDADHPAVYPPQLAYRMITRFTGAGDKVCDPWSGTGTTAVQSIMTGRPYLAIELGHGYAAKAAANIERAREATTQMSIDRLLRIEHHLKGQFVTCDDEAIEGDAQETKPESMVAVPMATDQAEVEAIIASALGGEQEQSDTASTTATTTTEDAGVNP